MLDEIVIKEGAPLKDCVEVDQTIIEFEKHHSEEEFKERFQDKDHLVLVAYHKNIPVGYVISYDPQRKDGDENKCCFAWMAGVKPKYRGQGIFNQMIMYVFDWAREYGFDNIKIKTRNHRREMLTFLIKNGFNIVDFTDYSDVKGKNYTSNDENRILFEKKL